MNIALVIGVLIVLTLVLLNTKLFDKKDKRRRYLESLAKFLEAKLEPTGEENSYRIRVVYKNKEFIFEDIEDRLQKIAIYKVYLKAKTASNLKISFTERPRTTIIANVQSLNDIKSPWITDADKVTLPPELQVFSVFTNDHKKAIALFNNDKVVDIFVRFKNMSAMGNPAMSLEIIEGVVTLSFHPRGELKPSWTDLQDNPSRIEDYMDQLNVVVEAVDAMKEK